ncbi:MULTISPECIES: phosphate-starvation-inducible protein PsiE [Bacillus cereus group]|uniref:Protein PsiE homolog n=2 Tax=Bacillus cytotoxicus TaxID=580165 RepID=A0AAX2CMH7_9BACI|nr:MULTISPECIES: phosphate-starvation-inducible protein PsiE [Bacillus cereus group]ABS23851.1 phosphate-starvation-inducible E [Bacillus cytotoxicus NVH 391-98]MDH2865178.1 phosphate-starvation-inducible protein PsiE [Bacillus cytotoxicus]MDH2884972.1 phosphate-starvation-inducible protein PsiE [Bacillus cytotoxicus]MDH2888553.1 phosphate-starvation-inducible protein PsiE [Bacillus cytotoxicus]NZD33973.1 phosphate-starvation-inducible protein PsiE [Bacillus cytotoxicus]
MKLFNIDHFIAGILQWILNIALIILLSVVLAIFLVNETITFIQYIFSAEKFTSYKLVESIIVYFLYFEFIALIIKYFKSNYHFPLRYFIYIGITALIRLIIVSHEEPFETLLYAGSILILIIALYISNLRDLKKH